MTPSERGSWTTDQTQFLLLLLKKTSFEAEKGFLWFFFGMLNQENLEVDLFSKADIQSLLRKSFTHCLLMFIVW